jgi:hypothetical protein
MHQHWLLTFRSLLSAVHVPAISTLAPVLQRFSRIHDRMDNALQLTNRQTR